MRKVIRFLAAATVIAAAPVIGLTAASPAYAAVSGTGCAGNGFLTIPSCSGLDPLHSYNFLNGHECSSGAYTVLARHVLGGYLELRWGPYCQTNWTRFTPGNNDEYEIMAVNATTGVWAGSGRYNYYIWSHQAGIIHYTDQVFAPDPQPAHGCVRDITTQSFWECASQ